MQGAVTDLHTPRPVQTHRVPTCPRAAWVRQVEETVGGGQDQLVPVGPGVGQFHGDALLPHRRTGVLVQDLLGLTTPRQSTP